jgi:hypothetical protein
MPGQMDGLGLAHAVRERWPWIRIIVTSGHLHEDDPQFPDGAKFLPKPFLPLDVIATTSQWSEHS